VPPQRRQTVGGRKRTSLGYRDPAAPVTAGSKASRTKQSDENPTGPVRKQLV
jgi:hypothetical protein